MRLELSNCECMTIISCDKKCYSEHQTLFTHVSTAKCVMLFLPELCPQSPSETPLHAHVLTVKLEEHLASSLLV